MTTAMYLELLPDHVSEVGAHILQDRVPARIKTLVRSRLQQHVLPRSLGHADHRVPLLLQLPVDVGHQLVLCEVHLWYEADVHHPCNVATLCWSHVPRPCLADITNYGRLLIVVQATQPSDSSALSLRCRASLNGMKSEQRGELPCTGRLTGSHGCLHGNEA